MRFSDKARVVLGRYYTPEMIAMAEDWPDASPNCEAGDHEDCNANLVTGPCFCYCHLIHEVDYFAGEKGKE